LILSSKETTEKTPSKTKIGQDIIIRRGGSIGGRKVDLKLSSEWSY
jgi:hypothetical protein